jgi:hypothetical protein
MSEFKLPLPRRLLRCDVPRHDDTLVGHDVVFDEIAAIVPNPADEPDLLLVVDELVDELSISLTLIAEVEDDAARVAEVA